MTLQKYSFKVIPKPRFANACADTLSHWDKLLGKEGILMLVVVLLSACPSTHHIKIDTEFTAKIHAEAENEQPLIWFDHVPKGWKAGSRLYVPTKLCSDLLS